MLGTPWFLLSATQEAKCSLVKQVGRHHLIYIMEEQDKVEPLSTGNLLYFPHSHRCSRCPHLYYVKVPILVRPINRRTHRQKSSFLNTIKILVGRRLSIWYSSYWYKLLIHLQCYLWQCGSWISAIWILGLANLAPAYQRPLCSAESWLVWLWI